METAPQTAAAAVPILHIHGTADEIVPLSGQASKLPGAFKPACSTQEAVDKWVSVNGCKVPSVDTELAPDPNKVTQYYFQPGNANAEIVLITVAGGGHLWPGVATPTVGVALKSALGVTNNKMDATSLIIEFFKNH